MIAHKVHGPVGLFKGSLESQCDQGSPGLGEGSVFAAKSHDIDRNLEQEPRLACPEMGLTAMGTRL